MELDSNLYRLIEADISPADFEIFCKNTLEVYAKRENLCDFSITHNVKVPTHDGTYQIDVYAEYTALGAKNIVFVECKKKDARKVERTDVVILYEKVKSAGANKGILISTTGYQTGAVQYAKAHGITLWQVCDRMIKTIVASAQDNINQKLTQKQLVEQYLPKYFMVEWDCDADYPLDEIYPTKEMYAEAANKSEAARNL